MGTVVSQTFHCSAQTHKDCKSTTVSIWGLKYILASSKIAKYRSTNIKDWCIYKMFFMFLPYIWAFQKCTNYENQRKVVLWLGTLPTGSQYFGTHITEDNTTNNICANRTHTSVSITQAFATGPFMKFSVQKQAAVCIFMLSSTTVSEH